MEKGFFSSLTINASTVGFLVGGAAAVGGVFGFTIDGADQASLTQIIVGAATSVTSLVAIIGRIRAGRKMAALAAMQPTQALANLSKPLSEVLAAR